MLASTHRVLMAAKDAEMDRLRSDLFDMRMAANTERAYHNDFVKQLAELSTKALTPAPPVNVAGPREPAHGPKTLTAIDFMAQGDMLKKRHLERFARAAKREGKDDEAISREILAGSQIRDDDGDGPV